MEGIAKIVGSNELIEMSIKKRLKRINFAFDDNLRLFG